MRNLMFLCGCCTDLSFGVAEFWCRYVTRGITHGKCHRIHELVTRKFEAGLHVGITKSVFSGQIRLYILPSPQQRLPFSACFRKSI
jgi:hypothetical protein